MKNHSPWRTKASLRRRRRFLERLTRLRTACRTSVGCNASIAERTLVTPSPSTAQTNQWRSSKPQRNFALSFSDINNRWRCSGRRSITRYSRGSSESILMSKYSPWASAPMLMPASLRQLVRRASPTFTLAPMPAKCLFNDSLSIKPFVTTDFYGCGLSGRLSVEIRHICVAPWFQIVVHLLQLNSLDHADPVVVAQTSRGEFRDQLEDLIREAADIQDVFALLGLDRAVGLNVNADHPRLLIAPLEFGPLRHRLGGAAAEAAVARRVDPRFAVRDVDDQVAPGLAPVEQRQRRAAIRAAAGQAGQFLGVGHHAVARVETYLKRLALERDDLGARVAAQHSSGHQRGRVNTANLAGCAIAVTSHRRMHRTRTVGEDVNLAFNIRDVSDGV